jgi:hypothetical protein
MVSLSSGPAVISRRVKSSATQSRLKRHPRKKIPEKQKPGAMAGLFAF